MLKCIKKTSLSFPYPLSVEIGYGLAYFLSTKSISLRVTLLEAPWGRKCDDRERARCENETTLLSKGTGNWLLINPSFLRKCIWNLVLEMCDLNSKRS